MLKSIILFIKAHIVATAITTTVVVSTVVATPIVVDNYKLEKSVKENIHLLAKNETESINMSETTIENEVETIVTNNSEPLTFRIEKVTTENAGTGWYEDENGVRTDVGGRNRYRI